MTSMREKIARSLYEATPFKETEGGYDRQSPAYQRMCLLLADAVLDALMAPTEGMVEAMDEHSGTIAPECAYQAGIQAARDGA